MQVFLNDRTIVFTRVPPEDPLPTDLVVPFTTREKLVEPWEDFKRYERYRKMIVTDPDPTEGMNSPSFLAFSSLFKKIPAGGGLVKNEQGEYLFIHRFGLWDLPKGKIDRSDLPGPGFALDDPLTARIAAIREVKEETGLATVLATGQLPSTWHVYQGREKWMLKHTQWFAMEADSAQPLHPATAEGIFLVSWIHPRRIHCVLSNTYESLRSLLLEIVL